MEKLLDYFYGNAIKERFAMSERKIISEKQSKIYDDCKVMLKHDEYTFMMEFLDEIFKNNDLENEYYYTQGLKKCIELLKELSIL